MLLKYQKNVSFGRQEILWLSAFMNKTFWKFVFLSCIEFKLNILKVIWIETETYGECYLNRGQENPITLHFAKFKLKYKISSQQIISNKYNYLLFTKTENCANSSDELRSI